MKQKENPIIDVSNVYYRYEKETNWILEDINLTVYQGEWLAITGHNGSGKSTLAKCLKGLIMPEKGTISVLHWDTTDKEKLWDIRRTVGMVFQNPDNQFVGATVKDDVAFGMENSGIERQEMLKRLETSLKQVRMFDYVDREPHQLSGGQKQRVAIAGIIALEPSIIILDEATSMLDPEGRKSVMKLMRHLNKENNITVISITHDLEEVIHADRMIVMNDGKVIKEGKPRDLFQSTNDFEKVGLDLPFTIKLRRCLKEKGLEISDNALFEEELVNELWTLYSTN
ncbi:energy-coupling factor ABC transporter ATP-binding protein [Terrilactibacillus sp. BCM23-1]|uniref:Energy-coupling factor ABC transporter ATP-binding protein n=1 Tax=Terrilactibacillus tamarindi TaxID=2599694 RepID=A0A6N8CSU5_9BACI|nr:energy-coupling factor ABC transporter ATP-binding protein [Terrilactibacillus tamarindi]MTT32738.1 energy-coupling factor ABC transporter ATP-binding protein [Terrilactibacillus tamarindi]